MIRTLTTVLAVAAATAAFGVLFPPREAVIPFLGLFFGSAAALGWVVWRRRRQLWKLPWKKALILVVLAAAVLRLAAFAAPISLSDDIWRYLWDGELVAAAESPYAESATERFERTGDDPQRYETLNRPDAQTLYPPLSQGVFAAAVTLADAFGGTAQRWLRALFVLFDLAGIAALCAVLVRLGRSPMWAVLYAWHPLAFWEVAAGGHTEPVGLVWLAAIIGFALAGRAVATGAAIALAGLAKWTFLAVSPVVALFLLRTRGWAAASVATLVALVVFAAGYAPFFDDRLVDNHLESIRLYTEDFSFNAPLYYLIRFIGGYREGVTEPIHHITRPLLTVATTAAIAAAAWWQDGSKRRFVAGLALAAGAYVVFSPVFHPWYALPFLALGAVAGWTTPAVLCAVIAVSYAFYAPWMTRGGEVALMAMQSMVVVGWAVWEAGPPLVQRLLRRRARWKAERVAERLDGGESILDLGAGEGYVGEVLSDEYGHRVHLADVVDRNRTDLEFTRADGADLPWEDDRFDVVVLCYVLHHADDPDRVLAEALRVGRRVVMLETVYEHKWDRRLTTVLDNAANALRGIAPEPLNLDTPNGWLKRLNRLGAGVRHWRWLGRGIHRHVIVDSGLQKNH